MKSGYKKLLIFEIAIILMPFLNSFVSSILGTYSEVIYLFILLFGFKYLFGFEKDRHHLWKVVCIDVLIFLLIFFLLYYLSGIFLSFTKTPKYLNFNGIFRIIIPLIVTIIFKEVLRYMMLKKSEGSVLLIVTTCLTFVLIDLFNLDYNSSFSTSYSVFIYIALVILPTISKNIACTYISYNVGYKPTILYLLITELYTYIIPIVPNPNEYIYSIIYFVLPFLLFLKEYRFFKRNEDEEIVREYHKRRITNLLVPSIIIIFLVYITSGYFHYHAIVIASGSMVPTIYKGDVVVIEKIDNNFNLLELGQVIAYKYNDLIIVHRLVKKVDVGGETIYYTKGDANDSMDNYKITQDMIIGTVNIRVPYIGLPTVWLRNL